MTFRESDDINADWDSSIMDPIVKESRNSSPTTAWEEEDVILEEIEANRFKLTVPKNVYPGDEIEVNNGQGQKKVVKIKPGVHAGDVFVIDFNDRKARQFLMPSTTTLDKPSITKSVGTVVRKMVNCGCIGDAE